MPGQITHNQSYNRIYRLFRSIKERCYNKKHKSYHNYGGRGIKIEWETFEDFFADMGEAYHEHVKKHGRKYTTLERKDNNKNYCKTNCIWITPKEQANNRRTCIFVKYKGKEYTVTTLCEELGISRHMVYGRLNSGMTIEEAVGTPTKMKRRKYIYKGEEYTIPALAKLVGMRRHLLYERLVRFNYPVEKAIIQPTINKYIYKGKKYTAKEIEEKFNMKERALYARLSRGMTVSEAIETPRMNPKQYKYKGKMYTLRELSGMIGIRMVALRSRLQKGHTLEEAMAMPDRTKSYEKR